VMMRYGPDRDSSAESPTPVRTAKAAVLVAFAAPKYAIRPSLRKGSQEAPSNPVAMPRHAARRSQESLRRRRLPMPLPLAPRGV